MAPLPSVGRRLLLAGGFSVAIAIAPAVAVFAAPAGAPSGTAVACPNGETDDIFTGECTPELAPNVPGGTYPTPADSGGTDPTPADSGVTYSTPGDVQSLPEVGGIPCTGADTGKCIGLQENDLPAVEPRTSISSSP